MKKILQSIVLLLGVLLPASAAAYDFEVDGIYYNINGNEAAVTFGTNKYAGDVTIPEAVTHDGTTYPVTYIGVSAFDGCSGLTSVTIPNTVSTIAGYSFRNCTGLTSLNIPNSVTFLGLRAFYSCKGLTNLIVPNSVTTIADEVFYGCSSLTSLVIGNSVNYIGSDAFYGCNSLTSIIVDSTNPKYDSRDNCNAIIETSSNTLIAGCSSTVIPNSITAIGERAFKDCTGLKGELVIPNSVTEIGKYAFYGCTGLTGELVLPSSLTTIGIEVFGRCIGLTGELVIPNSVTSIDIGAFEYCSGLTGELVIPNSVTSIGFGAFSDCTGFTSVIIPNSVTSIGGQAFYRCSGLTSVTIPNSITKIDHATFYYCTGLTNVTIPNSVTTIEGNAFFGCSGLTSITIPNSVTKIGIYAFARCYGLTGEVVIPNSVTEISDGVFAWCNGLTNIIVESGNPNYDSRDNCSAIIETSSNTLIAACINTIIPNSVTGIGSAAFCGLSGLTGELVIPNSVTWIGDGAFSQCTGLTSVTIPNSVISIGSAAFYHYPNLKDVYCYITDLESVSVGYEVFYCNLEGVYSDRTLHVPYGTAEAYQADGRWYPYFGQIVEDLMPDHQPGDVNCDGEVNIADINAVIGIIQGGNNPAVDADVNNDGEVNIADVNAVIEVILGGHQTNGIVGSWVSEYGVEGGNKYEIQDYDVVSFDFYGDHTGRFTYYDSNCLSSIGLRWQTHGQRLSIMYDDGDHEALFYKIDENGYLLISTNAQFKNYTDYRPN